MSIIFLRLGCLALLISCLSPMISEARLFNARTEYEVGEDPCTVHSVDLNGDGHLDLVTTNGSTQDRNVTILLGQGDGSFAPAAHADSENGPHYAAAIGDLDGNGSPDLAITNYNQNNVSILLGNGDGTFQPPWNIDTGQRPYAVALDDLDGDGILDMVTAITGWQDDKIRVFQGQGDGTFTYVHGETFEGDAYFHAIAIGDLNNDGDLDLVAAEYNLSRIYIFKGFGDCTFELYGALTSCGSTFSIALGDLDGDQKPDLVAQRSGTTIAVYPGNGFLTFLAPVYFTTGIEPRFITINDLDSDGNPDLVVTGSDAVAVLRGIGGGDFDPPTLYPAGDGARSAAIGDLNEDGLPDLATANLNTDTATVLPGTGPGTFFTTPTYAAGDGPRCIAHGDLDGDGVPDLAMANFNSDEISLHFNNGDGTLQGMTNIPVGNEPCVVTTHDLDDDGDDDLAVGYWRTNYVSVMLSNGDGTFTNPTNYTVGQDPRSLAIGDLDEDGVPDMAVVNNESSDVSILTGVGDGTFDPAITYDFWTQGQPRSIAMDDLDGDGHQDLVVVRYYSSTLDIGLGRGDGTFRGGGSFDVHNDNPSHVTTGDLNGSGIPEIVVAYELLVNTVSVYWDYQGLAFAADSQVYTEGSCKSAAIGDLNDDGIPDLAMANRDRNSVTVRLGLGSGGFSSIEHYGMGSNPVSIACVDLDGDGFLDVATADITSDTLSVLINTSEIAAGTVSAALTCTPGSGTLPFPSLFQANMTNNYAGQARRFHYTIDVTLAGGQQFSNWRSGWQNVHVGETYTRQWWQTIPDLPTVAGLNSFEMTVADVTPPPYNLPPYPPAGETDRDGCTVTGVAP